MSYIDEKEQYLSKEEVISWIKQRLEELENEIRILRSILAHYEQASSGRISPDEKVEEIKAGRRRIARLYIGENYIRLVPEFDVVLVGDLKEYLEETVEEIKAKQSREGIDERDQVKLIVKEKATGGVREIIISNIEGISEIIKSKAALKYIAELAWDIYKARDRD
ncbi:MAG: hypothetical protein F7C37_04040 [Desulfurococcales archaeon]|nr:hypothetical protein [Desulfurococcales archaeon]MCE4623004.1 hypothetical protein [Desulfurococcales archaeon]